MSSLDEQVGGNHYKAMAIQPVEYIHHNKIGYMAGNVIKYISRYGTRGNPEDLDKAIHYCELLKELNTSTWEATKKD